MIQLSVRYKTITIDKRWAVCPRCGEDGRRHCLGKRWLNDANREIPVVIRVTYTKHHCTRCKKKFNVDMTHLAPKGSWYTNEVWFLALERMIDDRLTLDETRKTLLKRHHVDVPISTLHTWFLEANGSKRRRH